MSCIVPNCPGANSRSYSRFRIPGKYLELWCANIKIDPKTVRSSSRICSRHFEISCLGVSKLKRGSMPTLKLGHNDEEELYHTQLTTYPMDRIRTRKCHVKACEATDPPDKLYIFPEDDEEKREAWIVVCSVPEKYLGLKHLYICKKHFQDEMIGKQRLRKDAFPTLHLGEDEEVGEEEEGSEEEEVVGKRVKHKEGEDEETENKETEFQIEYEFEEDQY